MRILLAFVPVVAAQEAEWTFNFNRSGPIAATSTIGSPPWSGAIMRDCFEVRQLLTQSPI